MHTENFHALALPYSVRPLVDPDQDFHVSVFISPHLVPHGSEEPLKNFDLFRYWASHVADSLEVRLEDQIGTIELVRPLLGKVEPGYWRQLFSDSTPVRANTVPDWRNRGWRSFDATLVANLAKILHVGMITSSLTETPSPLHNIGERSIPRFPAKGLVIGKDSAKDHEIESRTPGQWLDRPDLILDNATDLWDNIAEQFHRARRFYERPEERMEYQERPDPGFTSAPLPSPEPEFHERCAMAGDHPTLLRRLGLVIDLQVDDLERLANATYLVATISVGGSSTACTTQRVLCHATADGAFTTVSSSEDWVDGALALGDEKRFGVIDVDADGSALKMERFLGTVPSLTRAAMNGDPATVATPALRAGGFTLARKNRAYYTERQLDRQLQIEAGTQLPLGTEDVARGMRVEVWDDEVAAWHSLHERISELVVGRLPLTTTDPGFVQGAAAGETTGVANSKIHVHEAMVGWEGWSLSVERPGKRIRHTHGDPKAKDAVRREVVEETPKKPILAEKPPHPIRASHVIAKGSLPRLRFGRDYAFRAWAVDLAGNSRPHELNPEVQPNLGHVLSKTPGLLKQVVPLQPEWSGHLQQFAAEGLAAQRVQPLTVAGAVEPRPALAEALRERIRAAVTRFDRSVGTVADAVSRRSLVDAAAARVVRDAKQPLISDVTVRAPERLVDLVNSHAAAIGALEVVGSLAGAAAEALKTVTRLRPFLRWDPVIAPVVVPLKKYTEGESNRVVVIRSGVTQHPTTLAITVTDPAAYAAQANAVLADKPYAAVSSRHLAPPKTSQMIAELHGKFDLGIGTGDAAKNQEMLNWALIEDGTLLDETRGSLTDPLARDPQPGWAIVKQSDLAKDQRPGWIKGDPLGQGQYVVHNTEELTLPYLPDPLAVGISLVFPEAGNRRIPAPEGVEGFTASYPGTWPAIEPFRMDLLGSSVLGADVTGRVLSLRLPPADVQRFRLSSSLRAEDLHELGVWRHLAPALTSDPDVREAAKDGWIWGLTPYEDLTLVHAVPRPLEAPRPTSLNAHRDAGSNATFLSGVLDVHGPSTDSVIAEAAWTDPVDELDKDGPGTIDAKATAFQLRIDEDEDLLGLGKEDGQVGWQFENLKVHGAVHQIGDTKHHRVTYALRATTRFREYFHPDLLEPMFDGDDGLSVVAKPVTLSVPSSAPPAPPVVHSTIPLFRWDTGTAAEQPMGWQHERKVGVRIYLERPWFSSGEGELLGILLAETTDVFGPPPKDDSGFPYVSKIGADPIWDHREIDHRALSLLHLDNLGHMLGYDDHPAPGRPVKVQEATVRTGGQGYPVLVAGYQPQFSYERKLWYVDVAIDPWAGLEAPSTGFWPFLRLAVARFQPDSVPDCHLSAPVRCDYVQLPPERTTAVNRTDAQHVRVVVSGTRGLRDRNRFGDQNRVVVAALQKKDPAVPTDLGWITVDSKILPVRSDPEQWEVSWMGELDAGTPFNLRRPEPSADGFKVTSQWRVTVEEWEQFRGDPAGERETWERRLVYADAVLL